MTKRLAIFAITIAWIVSIGGIVSFAADQKTDVSGTISAINAADKSITIKDEKGKETTVTGLDEKTLGELKTGDMVTCTYVSEGGTNVCKAIMKKEGKKKPAAAGY